MVKKAPLLLAVAILLNGHADELAVDGGVAPTGQLEIVMLTHPPLCERDRWCPRHRASPSRIEERRRSLHLAGRRQ